MSRASTCASPSERRPARWRAALLAAAGAALVAGCFAAAVRLAAGPPRFDHAAHLGRDLACADCHEGAARGKAAGMPPADMCANCHDAGSDSKEIMDAIAAYVASLEGGRFPSRDVRGATYDDVIFDHAKHASAKVDCAACHAGATAGPIANPTGPLAMATCMECHERKGAKNDCATCHTSLGKDTPPANHDAGWTLHHGLVSRMPDRGAPAERCDLCHAQADCNACHAREPPRDHTNPFRVATHGLAASMDRSRCLACHQADSCDRCHQSEPPRSHRGGFGAPQNRHCVSCHLPVGGSSCATCHEGTPSHAAAPPKPPEVSAHRPDVAPTQCLACHRRVSHPVTFDDCNQCHR